MSYVCLGRGGGGGGMTCVFDLFGLCISLAITSTQKSFELEMCSCECVKIRNYKASVSSFKSLSISVVILETTGVPSAAFFILKSPISLVAISYT